jgi:hypothetical protein
MKKVDVPGWIGWGASPLITCRITLISATGATVVLGKDTPLPPECDLFLTADRSMARPCLVDRQQRQDVRLKFVMDLTRRRLTSTRMLKIRKAGDRD